MRQLLYEFLPVDGEFVGFEAVRAALSEKTGQDIAVDTVAELIFALGAERLVDWLPDERQVGRARKGLTREPSWPIQCERDLEPWLERYLWLHAYGFYDPPPASLSLIVENTARISAGAGRWTRPDVSMACVTRYRYQAVPILDVFTFELKMPSGCNMLAVHEALSHSSAANFAYLVVFLPEDARETGALPAMLEQAQRHGVGVMRIADPRDARTYSTLLQARRNVASPAKIDGFIEDRFLPVNKLALRRWVKP